MSVKPDFANKYYSYIGQKFNSLTITDFLGKPKGKHYCFRCKCDCGNETIVRVGRVLNGVTKTCGCQGKGYNYHDSDRLSQKFPKLYSVWNTMRHRCYNPKNCKYKNYGGRGIVVCKEWAYKFKPFFKWAMANGYQNGLTIDRIDVNGNYEPTNCRWITMREQYRNRTDNRYVTYKGETKPVVQWCEDLGLPYSTIRARILVGWTPERAFTTPVKKYEYKSKRS